MNVVAKRGGLIQSQPEGYAVGVQLSARIRKAVDDFKGQFKRLEQPVFFLALQGDVRDVLLAVCLGMQTLSAHGRGLNLLIFPWDSKKPCVPFLRNGERKAYSSLSCETQNYRPVSTQSWICGGPFSPVCDY